MIRAYTISDSVELRALSLQQTDNIDIIINRVLGVGGRGKIGEIQKYLIDPSYSDHVLVRYKNEVYGKQEDSDKMKQLSDILAQDLFQAELKIDDKKEERNNQIKQGVFIVKITSSILILLKLEDFEAIDAETFELKKTFGTDRNYFKAAIYSGKDDVNIIDRSRIVAMFWYDKFLHLLPYRSNELNTKNIAEALSNENLFNRDYLPNKKIKEAEKIVTRHLHSEKKFDVAQLVEDLFFQLELDGKPNNTILNQEVLQDIDEQFEIDQKVISNFFRRKFIVNDYAVLELSDLVGAMDAQAINVSQIRETGIISIKVGDKYKDALLKSIESMR